MGTSTLMSMFSIHSALQAEQRSLVAFVSTPQAITFTSSL
jgi:hypothetical protein